MTKHKVITKTISQCSQCPECSLMAPVSNGLGMIWTEGMCHNKHAKMRDPEYGIPDWCPLPDNPTYLASNCESETK